MLGAFWQDRATHGLYDSAMDALLESPPSVTHAYADAGVLLFAPRSIRNRRHAHFAATVLIAVEAPFALTLDGVGRRHYDMVLLGPNVQRQLDSEGHPLVDLLIDADQPAYRYLAPHLARQPVVALDQAAIASVRPQFRNLFAGTMNGADAGELVMTLLRAVTPEPPATLPWDERVIAAASFMRSQVQTSAPTLEDVAAYVGLSASRLRHLFREQLGLPVRQYLLWLRLRHAMQLWAQGQTLADIAHGAGFYDQAHFTRTLRRMTDYAPSVLMGEGLRAQPLVMPNRAHD